MSMKTAAGLSATVAKSPHDCQAKHLRQVCDNLNAHIYAGVPDPARQLAQQDGTGTGRPDEPSPGPARGPA